MKNPKKTHFDGENSLKKIFYANRNGYWQRPPGRCPHPPRRPLPSALRLHRYRQIESLARAQRRQD